MQNKKRKTVIVRMWGGLGNQLFQYAYARRLKQQGYQVFLNSEKAFVKLEDLGFVEREYGLKYFNITIPSISRQKLKHWDFLENETLLDKLLFELSKRNLYPYRFLMFSKNPSEYNEALFHLPNHQYIMGMFQNVSYFKEIRPVLLHELTLKKELKISGEIKDLLSHETTVSIHVRRGDYTGRNMVKNFGLCSLSYYKRAIEYMNQNTKNPVYLVFSDDLDWVKKMMKFQAPVFFINEDRKLKDVEELVLMSKCSHNIIANSSFSWWGAWLNQNQDKIVIAPKPWVKRNRNFFIGPEEWKWMNIR